MTLKSNTILLLLSIPVLYGLLAVVIKKATQGFPPFASIAISMFVLSLSALICSFLFEKDFSWSFKEYATNYKLLILVGFLNLVCFWFLIKALHGAEVWQQQMFESLKPVFAALFGVLILAETFSLSMVLGLALMSLGLFIAMKF